MKTKLILLSLLLISCGSRKVNKSVIENKEETKTEIAVVDKTETKTNTEINTVSIDTSQTSEIEITPVDNTKPINVNGKNYFNAKITLKNKKSGVVVNSNEKVAKIERNDVKTNIKAKTKINKLVSIKNKDVKQFNFLSLWWLYLLIALLIYLGWKNKHKLFGV